MDGGSGDWSHLWCARNTGRGNRKELHSQGRDGLNWGDRGETSHRQPRSYNQDPRKVIAEKQGKITAGGKINERLGFRYV